MTRQRPTARELLTDTSQEILTTVYPGQVRAVVIERALRRMAAADRRVLQGGERRQR
ncbi:hypothetical protein [Streptomyces griseofuscus]|uniref:hypothetical protein n=1 Tax=Streptomyces griseofuscus TaxID=146922 RepID=UPI00155AB061|nr:hypothetical protein [Streptomyces griseofuscus]